MVEADKVTVSHYSILAVPRNDRRLQAKLLSFGEAFAYTREKRSTRVKLSLSLRSLRNDSVPINGGSNQPFEVSDSVESTRRRTPAANRGQPVLECEIDAILCVSVAPRLECRNFRIDNNAVEVEEQRADHVARAYTRICSRASRQSLCQSLSRSVSNSQRPCYHAHCVPVHRNAAGTARAVRGTSVNKRRFLSTASDVANSSNGVSA